MNTPRSIMLALVLTACGTEAGGGPITLDGGGSGGKIDGSSLGALTGPCDAGFPVACTCPNDGGVQSGTQQCYSGNWLSCNCYASSTGGPSTPVPVNTAGECKPGNYEGEFTGLYTSPYTGVGFPIPVAALNPFGPGLAFTLNAVRKGGGEFTELTISDGYVKGAADGVFPFEGVLTGTLNCPTKTFTGALKGWYCVGPCVGELNKGYFEGPITGNYDGTSFSFTNGTWDLVEDMGNKPLFADNYGGFGDWKATWVSEGSVDLDSGVVTNSGDAGN